MARVADTVGKGPGLGELLCEGRLVVRTITLQTCQRPPLHTFTDTNLSS